MKKLADDWAYSNQTSNLNFRFPAIFLIFLSALIFFFVTGCSHVQIDGVPANDLLLQTCAPKTVFSSQYASGKSLFFDDVDGAGRDEIIEVDNDRSHKTMSMYILHKLDSGIPVRGGYNDTTFFSYAGKTTLEKYGVNWIVMTSHRKNGDLFILLFPADFHEKARGIRIGNTGALLNNHPGRAEFGKTLLLPRDDNHPPYLLATIVTAFSDVPRHLILVNLKTGQIEFDFKLGPMPGSYCVADFNGDGKPEILVGTWAPSNGAEANGLADSDSYLLLFSFQGKLLYKAKMGGYQTFVTVSNRIFPSSNGEPAVFVIRAHRSAKQSGADFIGRWSWGEREHFPKLKFRNGISPESSPAFIFNPITGKNNVLVVRSRQELVLVDEDLKILHTRKIDFSRQPSSVGFYFAGNFCKDDAPELVFSDRTNYFILSCNLDLLYRGRSQNIFGPIHWGSSYEGLAVVSPENIVKYNTIHCHWVPTWVRVGTPIFLLFLILFAPIYVSTRRAKKRKVELIQSQAFRAWVLESMDSGVVIFNAAGRLQTINRKAREILQMPQEAPASVNGFEKTLAGTPFEKLTKLIRALDRENRDTLQDELEIEIDQEKRRILITAERVRDKMGQILGRAVSLKDVTDLVRSRDALAWSNMARRLTHEVKTPLASMLLAAERLEGYFKSEDSPDKAKVEYYLAYLFKEIERLRNLAEAMLQLTDLEKKEQEKIDLNRIVREAVDQISPLFREGIEIELNLTSEPLFILGNPRQVLLAVTNVLRNAIQAIPKAGKIRLDTSVAQGLHGELLSNDANFAVLEISDTGTGIPDSARPNIFDPYFSLRKDGTGLGLAIVKKIVDDLGGKIEFQSEEGLGTTFWLYFPLYSEATNGT